MVVTLYVNGLTEYVQRVYKKYNVDVAMKPHSTLRNLLVHPKDKREKHKCSDCMYEIGLKTRDNTYISETSRLIGLKLTYRSQLDAFSP